MHSTHARAWNVVRSVMLARFRARAHTRAMPPLAIAAAITSALIHASWNAALKGGRGDRIADAFLIAIGGMLTWGVVAAIWGAPAQAAWLYLVVSVLIHLVYWFALFS